MIRIVIADDHALVRAGLKRLLEDDERFEVIGEAGDGNEALELVRQKKPDVLLLDIAMPTSDGLSAMKIISKELIDQVKVIILTMYADPHYAIRLLRMGALGFVVKESAPQELAEAIQRVCEGERYLSPVIRDRLADSVLDRKQSDILDRLTDREFEVLRWLAAGRTNREIAEMMGISTRTVDTHRLNLLAKLELRNNAELTRFALLRGLHVPTR